MAIKLNYNPKLSFLLSIISLVLIVVWFNKVDDFVILHPSYLFDFNLGVLKLPLALSLLIGLSITFLLYSLTYLILRENKLYEGDKSALLSPLILILSAFPDILIQFEWLLLASLFLVSIRYLSTVHNQLNIRAEASILGLFQGILVFFEPILILLAIPNIIGMVLLRSFQIRESLFFIISFLLLFFWTFSIFYLLDIDYTIVFDYSIVLESWTYNSIILFFFPIQIFIVFKAFLSSSKMVVRKKNQIKLFLGFLVTILFISLIIPVEAALTLALFPLILLFGIFFQGQTKQGLTSILMFVIAIIFITINLVLDQSIS